MSESIYDHEEIFAAYLKSSTEKEAFAERFAGRFASPPEPVTIADLGCNEGHLMLQYLERLGASLPEGSRLFAVEPNARSLEAFRRQASSTPWRFEWRAQSAEAFLAAQSERLDWIVASHSFYWAKSMETLVAKVVEASRRAVIVFRDKDELSELEADFRERATGEAKPVYTADDIVQALDKTKARYEREHFGNAFALPPFGTPAFALLVAFLIDAPQSQLTGELLEEVRDRLEPFGSRFTNGVSFFWVES